MTEIVFSESAEGSLKWAQTYGKGKWAPSSIGMIGSNLSAAEADEALREAERREQASWEQAVPLGGSPADVFSFPLVHSIGDISEEGIGQKRLETLQKLFGYSSETEGHKTAERICRNAVRDFQTVRTRLTEGGQVRIWYSDQPDEMCGMYWFLAQLEQQRMPAGRIVLVSPEDRNSELCHLGWGAAEHGEWGKHLSSQKNISQEFLTDIACRWKKLQDERAALRAVVDGKLCSVPEDFYDPFIQKELDAQEEMFPETSLMGSVLARHRLGISNEWIFLRIQKMVESGRLSVAAEAPEDMTACHRWLKKM